MLTVKIGLALLLSFIAGCVLWKTNFSTVLAHAAESVSYSPEGQLRYPAHYREWVYLSSGFNMSYSAGASATPSEANGTFDNVFVNPESYRSFQQTGTWPDKTILILEIRDGASKGSINKAGRFQSRVNHVEAHVKDAARFPGGWAFFGFDGQQDGKLFAATASCYTCHQQHAAVDTTFVQFYPTLLPIAERNRTLSKPYELEGIAATQH